MKFVLILFFLSGCVKNKIDEYLIDKDKVKDITLIYPASCSFIETDKQYLAYYGKKKPKINQDTVFHYDEHYIRAKEFINATKKSNKILWAYQGGYGSSSLIPYLEKENLSPKVLIGYSDITSLHLYFQKKPGWRLLHAKTFKEIWKKKDQKNLKLIFDIIYKKNHSWTIPHLKPLNHYAVKNFQVNGKMTGGNLTMIIHSIKTPWELSAQNKIIFLEDIGCKGYKLDRNFQHLIHSKLLKGAKAIVLGDFYEHQKDGYVSKAIMNFACHVQVPVYMTNMFGHGKYNTPILYNTNAIIKYNTLIMYK